MWRVYPALHEILPLQCQGAPEEAPAFDVLWCKAFLQVAIDRDHWQTAAHLLRLVDPLARTEWGGEEYGLERVFAYQCNLHELKKRQWFTEVPGEETEEKPKQTRAQKRVAAPAKGKDG